MAKKKAQGVNRSQAVRDYLADYPDAKPSVIIPDLAARGIDVTANLIHQVKRRMNESGGQPAASAPVKKRRGRKPAAKASAPRSSTSNRLTAENLVEAKKLVDELGGIDQARKALKYLEELG